MIRHFKQFLHFHPLLISDFERNMDLEDNIKIMDVE